MDKLEIGKRIKHARKMRNMTLENIAQKVSVARSTIQRYKAGKIERIKLPVLESIAKALDVSPSWLSGLSDDMNQPALSDNLVNVFPIERDRLPVLEETVCGGIRYADEEKEIYVKAGTDLRADFCLQAKDNSMINARIKNGDIILVRKQDMTENGEIAAVVVNCDKEATLKRLRKSDCQPDGNKRREVRSQHLAVRVCFRRRAITVMIPTMILPLLKLSLVHASLNRKISSCCPRRLSRTSY